MRIASGLLSVVLLGSCTGSETPAGGEGPAETVVRPDVVLVTLDTTRADRIGAYGYADAETPHLDALAAEGRRYERAYSPIPLTIPSHASVFSGKYPYKLGIRQNGDGKLGEEERTLTEVLSDSGYRTFASVAAFVTTRVWGFGQGFDVFSDDIAQDGHGSFWHAEREGELVVDDALKWYASQEDDGPRFIWVHMYDPHFPFNAPGEFGERYAKKPYDGEIAYVDHQIGRLREATSERPTLFVIVGDHGEGLGDHTELAHGYFVYDNTQRVPFIMSGPGVDVGVVEQPVGLWDVMPNVLDALDLPIPEGIDGSVDVKPDRPVYLEAYLLSTNLGLAPHRALVQENLKLIDTPRPELYDLAADPGEKNDLSAARPQDVERLKALLEGLAVPVPGASETVDAATRAQLEALGYVDGGYEADLAAGGPLKDPKDYTRSIAASQTARLAVLEGDFARAEKILSKLTEEFPKASEFANRLAMVLVRQGRNAEAAELLESLLEDRPDDLGLKQSVGTARALQGRYREASALFQEVADAMPFVPRSRAMAVAALFSDPTAYADAVALAERYIEAYPDDNRVAGLLGVAYLSSGREKASELLAQGMLANPPERDVALGLGKMERAAGNLDRAVERFEEELEHYPGNGAARTSLVEALSKKKDWAKIEVVTKDWMTESEVPSNVWHAVAVAQFNQKRHDHARKTIDRSLESYPDDPHLLMLDANLLRIEGKNEAALARKAEAEAALKRSQAE